MRDDLLTLLQSWGLNDSAISVLNDFGLEDVGDLENSTPSLLAEYCPQLSKLQLALYRTKWEEKYGGAASSQSTSCSDKHGRSVFADLQVSSSGTDEEDTDAMHDIFENVAKYTMQLVLKGIVVRNKIFSLSFLNSRIKNLKYGPDINSKPSQIRPQSSNTSNFGIRMSASEMRTFVAYFGLMVGHLVKPFDDSSDDDDDSGVESPPPPTIDDSSSFFYLYNLLREIISIVYSKTVVNRGKVVHLRLLINDFLALYMKLSDVVSGATRREGGGPSDGGRAYDDYGDGKMPPKFQFLTHCPNLLLKLGPLSSLSSMRPEGKHKFVQQSLASVSSSINPPSSAVTKIQSTCLRLFNMSMLLNKELPPRIHALSTLRSSVESIEDPLHRKMLVESEKMLRETFGIEEQIEIRYASFIKTSDSVQFSVEHGVCLGMSRGYPSFAEIIDFFRTIPDKKIYFRAYDFETIYFSEHYGAYIIEYTGRKSFYRLEDVVYAYPFPNTIIDGLDGKTYVVYRN